MDCHGGPSVVRRAIDPFAPQLPSQPEAFCRRYRRNFLRYSDFADGNSNSNWCEGCLANGLALGYSPQPVLARRARFIGISPGAELGLGARGLTKGFVPLD